MPSEPTHSLPERPNLRYLKDQAKAVHRAGGATSLADAQFQIARRYGFTSWPKLKAHVEALRHADAAEDEIQSLKDAIDVNDLARVRSLMTANPRLHHAPLGYGGDGPLTRVAEGRIPREPPGAERLTMARWMIDNGSDVHQGGDGPLARAALSDERIAMMELLVACGADVNAAWRGRWPILFSPCETLAPGALQWLLDHGADPNCRGTDVGTALDFVIGGYARSPHFRACVDILLKAGGVTRHGAPALLDLLGGRLDRLAQRLDTAPALVSQRFPEFDFGATGMRRLTLRGATLLHAAANWGDVDAIRLLLAHDADVNAPALVDEFGVGGQTPIFHAVTQFDDWGQAATQLLIEHGADLSVRVTLPGHYERPDETVECTPLEYATLFPEGATDRATVALLRRHGALQQASAERRS